MAKEKMEALVPAQEQPYPVPANWRWVHLQSISIIRTGKKDANFGSEDGQYPFFTCGAEPIRARDYSFDEKAILLAGNGDIGNMSIYEGKFEAYQRTYVVNISNQLVSTEYVFFYFKLKWVEYNRYKMYGTAIPYIRLGNLQSFPIPLAAYEEQLRIVKHIDELFASLDEAKEKAQAVVDGYTDRREALLYKAFLGDLTSDLRKERGAQKEEWKTVSLKDIVLLE